MSPASEAYYRASDLLCRYADAADRKDVDGAVALLGDAEIRFPGGVAASPDAAYRVFAALWAAPAPHRHVITNVRIVGHSAAYWQASAYYTRWVIDPVPVVQTLGRYDFVFDETYWQITSFTVTPEWSAPGAEKPPALSDGGPSYAGYVPARRPARHSAPEPGTEPTLSTSARWLPTAEAHRRQEATGPSDQRTA